MLSAVFATQDFEEELEANKGRIAAMQEEHGKFQAKHSAQLEADLCNPHELNEQVAACVVNWESLCAQLSSDVGKPVDDANSWLQELEAKLESGKPLLLRSNDVMLKQLTPLKVNRTLGLHDLGGTNSIVSFGAARVHSVGIAGFSPFFLLHGPRLTP